jgi:hypothetical protein
MEHHALPALPPQVAAAFALFPEATRTRLLEIRTLIFSVAASTEGVGPVVETLKWGEPAYLTETTRSGSTVRLGWNRDASDDCAVLFHCRTTLVETFRSRFPDLFRYQKNRAILLSSAEPLPGELAECLTLALTYHQRQRVRPAPSWP